MLELSTLSRESLQCQLHKINPFCWPKRTLRVVTALFFLILLPIYVTVSFHPASSIDYAAYPTLEIPEINLSTPVAELQLQDRQLIAPATIAGSYRQNASKTLLIGHSSTVFRNLHQIQAGDIFTYQNKAYQVTSTATLAKAEVNMAEILAPTSLETVIIMTCAGEPLPQQDATHRLIVTAIITDSSNLASN